MSPSPVRRGLAAATVVAGTCIGVGLARPLPAVGAASDISVVGHGFGHGRGMGQYGSLGYAVDKGWSYHQILDHYYGGTKAGSVPTSTVINVDITDRDGKDTTVVQDQGELKIAGYLTCAGSAPCAAKVLRTGPGAFEIFRGTSCSGGWNLVAQDVRTTTMVIASTSPGSDNRADMLRLCESAGSRWFRGDIWAIETGTTQATVNHVPVESYLRGVVPRESPAFWGSLGNGAGEQALLTQAVAARSYALASRYTSYADTCDTTACQVYGGRASEDASGNVTDLEGTPTYATSDSAVAVTAGEVRVPIAGGPPARTEFSSSTGGYTAGGDFPAVPDDGDATASNPNHSWTDQVAVADIQSAYGAGRGTFQSLEVTSREGHGDLGGRVVTLKIHFSLGDVSTTGEAFAGAVGLRSSWFAVTSSSPPPPPPPTTTPPNRAVPRYHVLTVDGTVYGFGQAPNYGSYKAAAANTTAVSLGEMPGGYWILAGNGTVHPFGAAVDHGSLGGKALNAAPFQIAPTSTGRGYWIVAFDGGVFSYGDATFYGSTGNRRLNRPVVGIAATPSGHGYWLVASDGGIFSFGDAKFYGSTGAIHLNQPIVAMAVTPGGHGYWLIASDGGVFSFGDARYAGSLPGMHVSEQAVALGGPAGGGYLVATTVGHVYGFGTPAAGGPADTGAHAMTIGLSIAR